MKHVVLVTLMLACGGDKAVTIPFESLPELKVRKSIAIDSPKELKVVAGSNVSIGKLSLELKKCSEKSLSGGEVAYLESCEYLVHGGGGPGKLVLWHNRPGDPEFVEIRGVVLALGKGVSHETPNHSLLLVRPGDIRR